jgi:hypothetical protein
MTILVLLGSGLGRPVAPAPVNSGAEYARNARGRQPEPLLLSHQRECRFIGPDEFPESLWIAGVVSIRRFSVLGI